MGRAPVRSARRLFRRHAPSDFTKSYRYVPVAKSPGSGSSTSMVSVTAGYCSWPICHFSRPPRRRQGPFSPYA